ncbi:maltooligosyl trehalose synthase [Stanieria cyanosphaera PCC 7437]|uniref:Maltooligosyl trehalose synthase n=1 Tax=Stanieria cyanosphaera (strain ATCC 29371 / PCC 7437) TaxID=111780 RepID=K9XRN1_STAC7|nr:malto-oligosyltrehalose synthase [Stanieria cyanosphaera]AFZ34739.1 maltooligosyl trehalose synthase [Stanieria cyanosphaera PCC 7437]
MRIPTATYRIQFHSEFNFVQAKEIINYLADLSISDLYASPIFKARQGSTHGYDVVDPTILNPELGTEEDFEKLSEEIKKYQLGWLQDIVPNHMAYDSHNLWLMDVLENGKDSEFFDFFDINWNQPYEEMQGRVLAPLLGDFYGNCLERGELKLNYDATGLSISYYGLRLPVRIESYLTFIIRNLGKLARKIGRQHPDFIKFLGILYLLKNIPEETKGKERYDQLNFVKSLLWETYTQNPEVEEFIQNNLQEFNGEVDNSESFNLLDNLLSEQFYRLSFWKVGAEEINYRRFFTVNELISVKVEEAKVFQTTHELIERFVKEKKFTGVRIDHIDGLYDPSEYLIRLREKLGNVYITVEKILELTEDLPQHWQIEGTSGYEFLNYVNGIFCCPENEKEFTKIYTRFTDLTDAYQDLVYEKKGLILERNLAGDLENLAQILKRIAAQTRAGSDFTLYGLKQALFELLALFPVYRTYIDADGIGEIDEKYVNETIKAAKKKAPLLVNEFNFIHKVLLLEYEDFRSQTQREEWLHFVMRSQQLTGPLMAKGVEDTLLYVYNRLLSLNEVGGNPSHFGISLDLFHQFNHNKVNNWLHGMNATATHDTKRGEDVRARINVLSEIPQEWEQQVNQWREMNRVHQQNGIPDANDEYFFYQTLLGAFPFEESDLADFPDRIKDYILKAVREAKVHTAWLRPDEEYEAAFFSFIDKVLDPKESNFWQQFRPFQKQIAEYGIYNSLSQVLIKNTAPGVPDLYQGAELWELSLVDPDNRRPVDYQKRREFLQEIKEKSEQNIEQLLKELIETKENGKIKLFLTHQLLKARKEYLEIFQNGNYQPIEITGKYQNHIIAFARNYGDQTLVAIAPRFLTTIIKPGQLPLGVDVWEDTSLILPNKTWHNLINNQTITGENLVVGEILQNFSVGLLVG